MRSFDSGISYVVIRVAVLAVLLGNAGNSCSQENNTGEADLEPPVTELDRTHWGFEPLRSVKPPEVSDPNHWCRNEIDQFILQRLQNAGLSPAPPAPRAVLLRRVTYDLTGLPPTPEEVRAFEQDARPDAWSRVIDRLLDSPAYGERWAQHWLDVARYAETDGFEHDLVRPNAWRYRDWVIENLNRDLPWRDFVRYQIAGDMLTHEDPAAVLATGFLLCGPDMPDLNLYEERRHNVLSEMTSTTGSVFLGLQIGCAQCHHHKFDPVSQQDFFRLRAFFESTEWLKEQPLSVSADPGMSNEKAAFGRVISEGGKQATFLKIRGDFRRNGLKVAAAFPRVLSAAENSQSDGRDLTRVQLADWLSSTENAAALRVSANRIWLHHFGEGLVRTPGDFGTMGSVPSNCDLLDWFASQLPLRHWSQKELHRLILTSSTWQQSSVSDSGQEQDPENRLLWRMNRQRLDGEAIRDTLLYIGGRLNRQMGGPGVRPPLPVEIVSTLLKGQWEVTSDEAQHRRRSVYLFVRRNLRYPLFEVFDRPDTNASCPQRSRSTIAPQSLALMNSQLSFDAAENLTNRILREPDRSDEAAVISAWQWCYGRTPSESETIMALEFLTQSPAPDRDQRLHDLCLALINSNEFLYLD
ncbi:MAG: DUF1549 domain-containing protein [Planctomyces sp.]|nr:DUF1549 domain-containing protein [Planctomyces sp.]